MPDTYVIVCIHQAGRVHNIGVTSSMAFAQAVISHLEEINALEIITGITHRIEKYTLDEIYENM